MEGKTEVRQVSDVTQKKKKKKDDYIYGACKNIHQGNLWVSIVMENGKEK